MSALKTHPLVLLTTLCQKLYLYDSSHSYLSVQLVSHKVFVRGSGCYVKILRPDIYCFFRNDFHPVFSIFSTFYILVFVTIFILHINFFETLIPFSFNSLIVTKKIFFSFTIPFINDATPFILYISVIYRFII